MLVIYAEEKKAFSKFLTELCAIVGGVYTITALIDVLFYRAERVIRLKQAMGKSK